MISSQLKTSEPTRRSHVFILQIAVLFSNPRSDPVSSTQVISHNLLYGHNSYFSSGWNIMDGILVLISVVDLCMSLMSTGSPKIFNILRVSIRRLSTHLSVV